jgi:protein ImuA
MRAGAFMARENFTRLRREIAEIEGASDQGIARVALLRKPREDSALFGSDVSFPESWSRAETLRQALMGRDAVRFLPATPSGGPLSAGNPPARDLLSPRRGGAVVQIGVPEVDKKLGGGLRRAALHELRGETTREAATVAGFAAALLSRLMADDQRPVLFVVEEAALSEGGVPYGPGLDRFGLDSRRLVIVIVTKPGEALWVFEEGLRSGGLAAVLCELRGNPKVLDLTASRRLALRARENGVMGLLLRQAGMAEPGAATTRWAVSPHPATVTDDFPEGIGRPVWRLALERNRAGATGDFCLEWDHERRIFAPVATLPVAGAPVPADRPHPPRTPGEILALRRAS